MTRILIVEDEQSFSEPLSFLLGKEGYETEVAPDGNKLYAVGADGLLYISNENNTGFSNAGIPNPGVIMDQLFLKDNKLHFKV